MKTISVLKEQPRQNEWKQSQWRNNHFMTEDATLLLIKRVNQQDSDLKNTLNVILL